MRGKTNFILRIFISRGHHNDVIVEIRAIFHGKFSVFFGVIHTFSPSKIFSYSLREKRFYASVFLFFRIGIGFDPCFYVPVETGALHRAENTVAKALVVAFQISQKLFH